MSEPLPIACTLGASALSDRMEEIRAFGNDGSVEVTSDAGRAVLRFRGDPGIRDRVEAIVAAESECCAFLDFTVEHGEDATVLTISAPSGGAEMVHELAAAFAGR
jgi:hypothetical protein